VAIGELVPLPLPFAPEPLKCGTDLAPLAWTGSPNASSTRRPTARPSTVSCSKSVLRPLEAVAVLAQHLDGALFCSRRMRSTSSSMTRLVSSE